MAVASSGQRPLFLHYLHPALTAARPLQDVAILFSDVVGFTDVSSRLDARDVQRTLDEMYRQFDSLVDLWGLFRVEIIGDAFMAVSNMVEKHTDYVARLTGFAMDMLNTVRQLKFVDRERGTLEELELRIRIGIHAGPVVATVLGGDRPRFTLIGDTVNTSSRMESSSQPMRIHMSRAAAILLRKQNDDMGRCLKSRGEIDVKGKGRMRTYWFVVSPWPRQEKGGEGPGSRSSACFCPRLGSLASIAFHLRHRCPRTWRPQPWARARLRRLRQPYTDRSTRCGGPSITRCWTITARGHP